MNREFKFRHANEIAGVFVIGAAVLFVLGIVFAGRSQGWFEPRFTLNVVFDTPEGSYGLQEGAPVLVRNTKAGRVGPVLPTPEGLMTTTLILKDRFRPFVTTDSIAKVKKKFGVAGDSYVDIARGRGDVVTDGAYIACEKDEELIETAQKMLADVQTNIMPILAQAEAIITSVASILDQIDTGKGVAGAAIGDAQLRDDVAAMIANLEGVTAKTEKTIGTVDAMMSNDVAQVIANVGTLSAQSVALMRDKVPRLADETVDVQMELTRTLAETRRLIEGLQRHWLLRKYVVHEPERHPLISGMSVVGADTSGRESLQTALAEARRDDDPERIRLAAYNMAVYELSHEQIENASRLLHEIRFANRLSGHTLSISEQLLAAEIMRRRGNYSEAAEMATSLLQQTRGRRERQAHAETWVLLTTIYIDSGNASAAKASLKETRKAIEHADSAPASLLAAPDGLQAHVARLDGDLAAAAAAFAAHADALRDAGNYVGMTASQEQAASLYATLGMSNSAATYYLRAASGLLARDLNTEAETMLKKAREQARFTGDDLLMERVIDLSRRLMKK